MNENEGRILKRLLKTSEYSIIEIARKTGISRSQLYKLKKQLIVQDKWKNKLSKAGILFTNYKPPGESINNESENMMQLKLQHLSELNETFSELINSLKEQLASAKEEIIRLRKQKKTKKE